MVLPEILNIRVHLGLGTEPRGKFEEHKIWIPNYRKKNIEKAILFSITGKGLRGIFFKQ